MNSTINTIVSSHAEFKAELRKCSEAVASRGWSAFVSLRGKTIDGQRIGDAQATELVLSACAEGDIEWLNNIIARFAVERA